MSELHSGNQERGNLQHLVERSSKYQAELRARGNAIERGDPSELSKLRLGLVRHMGENNYLRRHWWRRLMPGSRGNEDASDESG